MFFNLFKLSLAVRECGFSIKAFLYNTSALSYLFHLWYKTPAKSIL